MGVARPDGVEDDGLHGVGPLGAVALLQEALVAGGEEGVNLVDVRAGDSDRFAGSSRLDETAFNVLLDVDQPVVRVLEPGEPSVEDPPRIKRPGDVGEGVPKVTKNGEGLGISPCVAQARREFKPLDTGALVDDPANSGR